MDVLREQAQFFSKRCKGDEILVKVLDPTVDILVIIPSTLVKGVELVRRLILLYYNVGGEPTCEFEGEG